MGFEPTKRATRLPEFESGALSQLSHASSGMRPRRDSNPHKVTAMSRTDPISEGAAHFTTFLFLSPALLSFA